MNLKCTPAAAATVRRWLAVAGAMISLILLLLSLLALAGCHIIQADTSFTPKPSCDAGQTAQRMPSHQHYMWTCAPGGPAS